MPDSDLAHIYQLKVWVQEISPMVWRRLLIRSDSTIADLHYIIQIAFGWDDVHLNRFHIHGKDFGVYHDGGMSFADHPEKVFLSAFSFRLRERFLYEYDFGDLRQHEVRIEKFLPVDPKKKYPVCIDGKMPRRQKNVGVHCLICRCEKISSIVQFLAMTRTKTWSIQRLILINSPAATLMFAYGNMRKVITIGYFYPKRRAP